jgi:hypothetical protein
MYDEVGLPAYNGKSQRASKVWVTTATSEQLAMIAAGEVKVDRNNQCKLPSTFDEKLGERVEHFICRRDPYPTMIVNRASVWTTGILGINLLRTCKQFRDEGAPLLYSNQFVIDTRGQAPFTHQRGVHDYDALNAHRYLVPGLLKTDGTNPTHRQTMNAVDKMFNYKSMHQPFMCRDPLATFVRTIGQRNAGYIKSLTIQGFFKTVEKHGRFRSSCPITFAKNLPIHAAIIQHALPNLTKLAIYQGNNGELWEDDLENQLGMTDEERYDEVIGKVVNVLPGLQELQHANYKFKAPKESEEGEDDDDKEKQDMTLPWGKALRWEGIVEQRYRQRKIEQKLEEEREAKRVEVDQYIWKERNNGKRGGRGGRGRGGDGRQNEETRSQSSSSNTARYNASFAALVDNAAAAAGVGGAGSAGGRPSFKRGKKLTRGGNTRN